MAQHRDSIKQNSAVVLLSTALEPKGPAVSATESVCWFGDTRLNKQTGNKQTTCKALTLPDYCTCTCINWIVSMLYQLRCEDASCMKHTMSTVCTCGRKQSTLLSHAECYAQHSLSCYTSKYQDR